MPGLAIAPQLSEMRALTRKAEINSTARMSLDDQLLIQPSLADSNKSLAQNSKTSIRADAVYGKFIH
jgi:hypothetical protein